MPSLRAPISLLAAVLLVASACTGNPASAAPGAASPPSGAGVGPTGSPAPAAANPAPAGSRPSSPARIAITAPASGSAVSGSSVHVVISLDGAEIVSETTTNVRPDQGHVHLYVDNSLVSMNYGLEQDLPVHPGASVLKAEFVASDHAPFSPRVWSNEVVFTVK